MQKKVLNQLVQAFIPLSVIVGGIIFLQVGRQVFRQDGAGKSQHQGTLDHVFKFPDVSAPVITAQNVLDIGREVDFSARECFCVTRNKMIGEKGHIFQPFPERRHVNMDDVEAVIQVFAKLLQVHHVFQVLIGCGNDPDINGDRVFPTYPVEFIVLQDAEDFGLQGQFHIADFIEKQGASIGLLKFPHFGFYGPGESAAFVAEQFRF